MLARTPEFIGFECLDCLLADKNATFYLHEQCKIYEDIADRYSKFQLLNTLCSQILAPYNVNTMLLHEYIRQNWEFFETDRVIQEWFVMLHSDVDSESELLHRTQASVAVTNESSLNLDLAPRGESRRHDIYVSLYLKNHKKHIVPQMPLLSVTEWNQEIDFDALLQVVECRAVFKLKANFIQWMEKSLVPEAIRNAHMFEQLPQRQLPQLLPTTKADEDQPMEEVQPEMCVIADDLIPNP